MEETKNKKNINKNKESKINYKKRRMIALTIVLVLILTTVILAVLLNRKEEKDFVEALLSNQYYAKMVEVDSGFKQKGEVYKFVRDGENLAIVTDTQTLILKDEVYAQIFHKEKLVTQFPRDSIVNNINIGITSLAGKELMSETEETLNNEQYTCKTYKGDIKLYSKDGEVKYIVTKDGIIEVLEFEGKVNEELFEIPEGYTLANTKE